MHSSISGSWSAEIHSLLLHTGQWNVSQCNGLRDCPLLQKVHVRNQTNWTTIPSNSWENSAQNWRTYILGSATMLRMRVWQLLQRVEPNYRGSIYNTTKWIIKSRLSFPGGLWLQSEALVSKIWSFELGTEQHPTQWPKLAASETDDIKTIDEPTNEGQISSTEYVDGFQGIMGSVQINMDKPTPDSRSNSSFLPPDGRVSLTLSSAPSLCPDSPLDTEPGKQTKKKKS